MAVPPSTSGVLMLMPPAVTEPPLFTLPSDRVWVPTGPGVSDDSGPLIVSINVRSVAPSDSVGPPSVAVLSIEMMRPEVSGAIATWPDGARTIAAVPVLEISSESACNAIRLGVSVPAATTPAVASSEPALVTAPLANDAGPVTIWMVGAVSAMVPEANAVLALATTPPSTASVPVLSVTRTSPAETRFSSPVAGVPAVDHVVELTVRVATLPISAMVLLLVSAKPVPVPALPASEMTLSVPPAVSCTAPVASNTRLRAMPLTPLPDNTMPVLMLIAPATGVLPSRLPSTSVSVPAVPADAPTVLIALSSSWDSDSVPVTEAAVASRLMIVPVVCGAIAT